MVEIGHLVVEGITFQRILVFHLATLLVDIIFYMVYIGIAFHRILQFFI